MGECGEWSTLESVSCLRCLLIINCNTRHASVHFRYHNSSLWISSGFVCHPEALTDGSRQSWGCSVCVHQGGCMVLRFMHNFIDLGVHARYLIAKLIYHRDIIWLWFVGIGQQDVVGRKFHRVQSKLQPLFPDLLGVSQVLGCTSQVGEPGEFPVENVAISERLLVEWEELLFIKTCRLMCTAVSWEKTGLHRASYGTTASRGAKWYYKTGWAQASWLPY